MARCLFASDLHGSPERYEKLFREVAGRRPEAVFLGGDLLPCTGFPWSEEGGGPAALFVREVLGPGLRRLRDRLGAAFPRIFLVFGNDDPRVEQEALAGAAPGLCEDLHMKSARFAGRDIFGYACVPPTPFLLKDWERYDVSRHLDPGCISPEEGLRTVPVPDHEIRFGTIARDLAFLAPGPVDGAIFLLHAPPYGTSLDRAALDGQSVDHVPVDLHLGSIAVRRLIEERGPALTLHGHVHESTRLTGVFKEKLGRTWMLQAAHDGPELALVTFDLENPGEAVRTLV